LPDRRQRRRKTSTLKALCRLVASRARTLRYRGEDISASPVHALPRKGLVMVPEGRGIFRQLTVEENLAMGAYALGGGDPRAAIRELSAFEGAPQAGRGYPFRRRAADARYRASADDTAEAAAAG